MAVEEKVMTTIDASSLDNRAGAVAVIGSGIHEDLRNTEAGAKGVYVDINIAVPQSKQKVTRIQKILRYVWDTFGKEREERLYVQKLDRYLFLFGLLSDWVKYLDQTNVSNAYVSGMSEDMHMVGQDRNLLTTFFNIGYLVGAVPSQLIMNRVRPSVLIPTCEIVWSVLVMLLAACKTTKAMFGVRFLIGLFEAPLWPGMMTVIGSWYTPDELGKRVSLFGIASSVAGMFSGYIQAGVYVSMNGRYGIAGWKWLFLIDGIISIPCAVIGYYCIPDFPTTTRARWLTQKDREYGVKRMAAIGRKGPQNITMGRFFNLFKSWRPWAFLGPYCIGSFGGSTGYFNLWLKAEGYSVTQINVIPTAGSAIGVLSGYLWPTLADLTGVRWPYFIISNFWYILGNLILAIWNVPSKVILFANLIQNLGDSAQNIFNALGQEAFQDDTEARSISIALGNTVCYVFSAWLPLVLFPTNEAPHYKYGYKFSVGFYVLSSMSLFLFMYLSKREVRLKGKVKNEFGLYVDSDEVAIRRDYETTSVYDEGSEESNADLEKGQSNSETVVKSAV
ncbi:major facilitator superfamily domain-containing protein [Lipomyces oligophaga]|uniref:major facilitator superfamily domain-containing protein n=1 Tax=Lipomyces oligophaga TaxID=45792 RepID=UPI0034CEA286